MVPFLGEYTMTNLRVCFLALILVALAGPVSVHAGESSFVFPESGLEVDGRVTLLAIYDHALRAGMPKVGHICWRFLSTRQHNFSW